MPKIDYIKKRDLEFVAQLTTFKNNIGDYATTLGLTPAQVTAQALDADYFNQTMCCLDLADKHSQQRTAWKNLIRKGGDIPPSGAPVAPTYPDAAPAVAPGVEARFRDLVGIVKAHPAYNVATGEALGIEGDEQGAPDLAEVKPVLRLELYGGNVFVRWGWEGLAKFLDLLEIQVDRGQGWTVLCMDSTPDYLDTAPLPATPAKWIYRAIYRVGDGRVGQWSDEASITVGG